MAFDDIVTGADQFPDTTELTIGDQKFTLGDIRGRLSSVSRERDEFKNTSSVLEQTLAAMKQARESGAAEAEMRRSLTPEGVRETQGDPADAWRTAIKTDDPYSQVILSEARKLAAKELDGKLSPMQQQMQTQFTAAARLLARMQAQSEFKDYEWPKDYTPKRAYEEAAAQGLINKETGFPDLGRLNYAVTEPMRIEKQKKSAYEEGFKAAETKLREEMAEQQRSRFKVVSGGNAVTGEGKRLKAGEKPRNLRGVFDNMEITPEDVSAAVLGAGSVLRS